MNERLDTVEGKTLPPVIEKRPGTWETVGITISDFRRAFGLAPLVVIALALYSALPSRLVFPNGVDIDDNLSAWHPAHINIGDPLLIGAVFLTWVVYRPRLDRQSLIFLSVALAAILVSLFFGSVGTEPGSILDSLTYWLRFAIAFSISIWIVECAGARAAESLLFVLFGILCITALAVFSLDFGIFNRIYSSAMTVASFSQVAVVVILIAIVRRQYIVITVAMAFLILTFSFTSIALVLGLATLYILFAGTLSLRRRLAFIALIFGLLIVGTFIVVISGQFNFLYAHFFGSGSDTSSIEGLHGRTVIWQYGLSQITSGSVGLLGIGFDQTPSLLSQAIFNLSDAGINSSGTFTVLHFHTIWLEFSIGLGILSLVLLYPMVLRSVQTWVAGCYPAALIFGFFLLCQSVDFTLYRPKEMLFWGLMLGIAEGQWRLYSAAGAVALRASVAASTQVTPGLRLQEQGH